MMTPDAGGRFLRISRWAKKSPMRPRARWRAAISPLSGALWGRHILNSSLPAAQAAGYANRPLENWLVFHIVFGKTVPDISRNAIANLGYAEGRFLAPVYCGDTVSAASEVTGLRENSNGKAALSWCAAAASTSIRK